MLLRIGKNDLIARDVAHIAGQVLLEISFIKAWLFQCSCCSRSVGLVHSSFVLDPRSGRSPGPGWWIIPGLLFRSCCALIPQKQRRAAMARRNITARNVTNKRTGTSLLSALLPEFFFWNTKAQVLQKRNFDLPTFGWTCIYPHNRENEE